MLTFSESEQLIINAQNWWIKAATLHYVDKDFVNNMALTTARSQINEAASLLLKEFGVIGRARSSPCGIEAAINVMLRVPILDINWRTIFTTKYLIAQRKIIRAKGYFRTDPSAWVNIIDTFNDLLLEALFRHDGTIGSYQLGNIGGVLNSTSSFATRYSKIYRAVSDVHNKRLESDLSHTKVRRTGRATRPINFRYIPKACNFLKRE